MDHRAYRALFSRGLSIPSERPQLRGSGALRLGILGQHRQRWQGCGGCHGGVELRLGLARQTKSSSNIFQISFPNISGVFWKEYGVEATHL